YDALAQNVKGYSPEAMAPICGIPADTIREVARLYATSKGSMILWGMGISQHVHGTDNARCLIALSLMTGQIGRPGTGLHPQRGRQALEPPGQARQDLWIIRQLAQRVGVQWPEYGSDNEAATAAVFDEMRRTMPSISGITWERLQREHSVTYPCSNEGDAGTP